MKNSITQITENFIKNIGEIFKESEKLYETEEKIKLQTQNLATSLVKLFIEQIDNEILQDKKKRKAEGYSVERHGDRRSILFSYGQVEFERTYYKKASGGYEYLADTAVGINERDRISENMLCSLATGAKDMSYAKASRHITGGKISRQTVMNCVRKSRAEVTESTEKRAVSELHIDADEAHVTLIGGKKSIVPLVSVYEGIETIGKRKSCKNVFHISEYGKNNDDFWEQVLDEIEKRYILDETEIYLHADGGGWIQKGLEWLPNAKFVLDKYHKNKAIKAMTAGIENKYRNNYDKEIRKALNEENLELYEQLTGSLIMQNPDRAETISQNAAYLQRFVKGISICKKDERANNGGCTEPHISHVLAARLSSRPLAWSETTLKHLAPILAAGNLTLKRKSTDNEQPVSLRKAAARASKAFLMATEGLPSPNAIGTLQTNGKVTSLQKVLKLYH